MCKCKLHAQSSVQTQAVTSTTVPGNCPPYGNWSTDSGRVGHKPSY